MTGADIGSVAGRWCELPWLRTKRSSGLVFLPNPFQPRVMTGQPDAADLIDAFLAKPKRLLGVDVPSKWPQGWGNTERIAQYPIEIAGESSESRLQIASLNTTDEFQFRLCILMPYCISRLDHTNETHQNTLSILGDNIPFIVRGPHYHSWVLNRRFFKGMHKPTELRNASRFSHDQRSFDSILRWFMGEVGLESLPANHAIALPPRDWLL